jgi:hypothetical protein
MWLYDYYIHMMLQMYFKGPASMIARNDEMEKFIKQFSLNGLRSNLCKPY